VAQDGGESASLNNRKSAMSNLSYDTFLQLIEHQPLVMLPKGLRLDTRDKPLPAVSGLRLDPDYRHWSIETRKLI